MGKVRTPLSHLYSMVLKVLPRAIREEKSEKLSIPTVKLNKTESGRFVQGGWSASTGHLLRSIANTARGDHMHKPATALLGLSKPQLFRICESKWARHLPARSLLVHSVVMVRLDGQSVPTSSGESTTPQMPISPSHSVACVSGCEWWKEKVVDWQLPGCS